MEKVVPRPAAIMRVASVTATGSSMIPTFRMCMACTTRAMMAYSAAVTRIARAMASVMCMMGCMIATIG